MASFGHLPSFGTGGQTLFAQLPEDHLEDVTSHHAVILSISHAGGPLAFDTYQV